MIATNPNQLAWDTDQPEDGAEDDFDADAALEEAWAREAEEAEQETEHDGYVEIDGYNATDTHDDQNDDPADSETEETAAEDDAHDAHNETDAHDDETDETDETAAEDDVHGAHNETDTHDDQDDDETEETETVKPRFANVFEWVDGFFIKVIRRRINPDAGKGLSWDQRWWLYPEVVGRLKALHQAWEKARADKDPAAMSTWWIQHLEPHLRVILDGDTGPMSHAPTMHPTMGSTPVPDAARAAILGE